MNTPTKPRAFTLIETVVSLSIMSILLLGLSGAVMISTRALPTPTQTGINDQEAIDAINRFRTDLRQTTKIVHVKGASQERLTLTLYDDGKPGKPVKAEYRYDTSDKALYRSDTNKTETLIIPNVTVFVLQFGKDGSDATHIWLMMLVPDTIQGAYDIHATLPYKPKVS